MTQVEYKKFPEYQTLWVEIDRDFQKMVASTIGLGLSRRTRILKDLKDLRNKWISELNQQFDRLYQEYGVEENDLYP